MLDNATVRGGGSSSSLVLARALSVSSFPLFPPLAFGFSHFHLASPSSSLPTACL